MSTLHVELWSQTFTRLGFVNDATRVKLVHRHNGRGLIELAVPLDHNRIAALLTPGVRCVATFTADGGTPVVISGRMPSVRTETLSAGSGPAPAKVKHLVTSFVSDWSVFDVLAWPVPSALLTAQAVPYWVSTGPAETVIKALANAASSRLGLPVTIPASSGRGATVTASLRMTRVSDAIAALADAGGIGVSIVQSGAGWALDCYLGADRTARTLSEAGGTITDWSWTATPPKATRVVVGGQGEAAARVFRARLDAAAESAWGVVEEFIDARDLSTPTDLDARGNQRLAEMAATSGFAVTLAETDTVAYGRNLAVGDLVKVEVVPGVTRTDLLREVSLEWTTSDGLKVQPVMGDPDAAPERLLTKTLRDLSQGLKTLGAR